MTTDEQKREAVAMKLYRAMETLDPNVQRRIEVLNRQEYDICIDGIVVECTFLIRRKS